MQDAAIDSSNTNAYGDGIPSDPANGWTSLNNSGLYEYVVALGPVPVTGGLLPLQGTGAGNGLLNAYTNAAATGTQGQRRFQVIRVPQYSSATLTSGLTALAWNGTTGGVLAIDVSGALALGSATVSVDGQGFRGGGARQLTGGAGGANTDYVALSASLFDGQKGEGVAGTPFYVFDSGSGTVVASGSDYPNGAMARGGPGNGGGGGT
ncbi:MAG: isopeptide-forming domain-containing fimbrial protein, partial [Thermoanaerobaculia bacterium]